MTGRLHHELLRSLIDRGVLPSHDELQARLGCSATDLDLAFDELSQQHGVVLHPGTRQVWAIHPFSLAPTMFMVQSGERKWWGNCAWCSLGIAALIGSPCEITTTLGAEGEQVRLTVADGRLNRADLVVHFPVPMTRAWDNVIYTCSTMLIFRDHAQVRDWSARHQIAVGDIQPVTKVLDLAIRWYGEYARPDWRKRTVAEAREVFAELGLTHPVWELPPGDGRF